MSCHLAFFAALDAFATLLSVDEALAFFVFSTTLYVALDLLEPEPLFYERRTPPPRGDAGILSFRGVLHFAGLFPERRGERAPFLGFS